MNRFAGLPRAYGIYQITEEKESGKKVGKAITKREPVTEELWQGHLEGKQGIGIVPVRDDGTCVFGAIDIDSYKNFDVVLLAQKVSQLKIPLAAVRSKSGGCHLYLFANEPVQASLMRTRLGEFAKALGYPTAEIFPKQDKIDAERNDVGGWINQCYFAAGGTCTRFMVMPDGRGLSAVDFLAHADGLAQDPSFFNQPFKVENRDAYFPEGPPCLQSLVQIQMADGNRNNGLLNVAMYLKKAFPDDWKKKVYEYNQLFFEPPLGDAEIDNSIIRSVARKNYRYTCGREPIQALCNSAVCRTRRYGVGFEERQIPKEDKEKSDEMAIAGMPVFGQLKYMRTEPPRWLLEVGGHDVQLTTEELVTPRAFQKRVVECALIMMPIPSQAGWQRIVEDLLNHSMEIDVPQGDNTVASDFWELIEKYLTTKAPAQKKEQVAGGAPWTEDGYTWFNISGFKKFLRRASSDDFQRSQITALLRAHPQHKYATWEIEGREVVVWGLPEIVKAKPKSEPANEVFE